MPGLYGTTTDDTTGLDHFSTNTHLRGLTLLTVTGDTTGLYCTAITHLRGLIRIPQNWKEIGRLAVDNYEGLWSYIRER